MTNRDQAIGVTSCDICGGGENRGMADRVGVGFHSGVFMRFGIRQMVIGGNAFVLLTEEEFNRIRDAIAFLIKAHGIEQKIHVLRMNYVELEHAFLSMSIHRMTFARQPSEEEVSAGLATISLRFINLLTTCRLYIDHIQHDVSRMHGRTSEEFALCRSFFSEEYDARRGYRMMESLRNYVQHQGMPIDGLHLGSSRIEVVPGPSLFEHHCSAWVSYESLRDGLRPARVFEELASECDRHGRIDLLPPTRDYVAGLNRVHKRVRDLLRPLLSNAETTFREASQRYAEAAEGHGLALDGQYLGLAIVCEVDRRVTEEHMLFPGIISRRQALESDSFDLTRSFATSMERPDPLSARLDD